MCRANETVNILAAAVAARRYAGPADIRVDKAGFVLYNVGAFLALSACRTQASQARACMWCVGVPGTLAVSYYLIRQRDSHEQQRMIVRTTANIETRSHAALGAIVRHIVTMTAVSAVHEPRLH